MNLTNSEWERIYEIEDNLKKTENKDAEFLLELIRIENRQLIDPRTHKKIQDMIDNFIELPQ